MPEYLSAMLAVSHQNILVETSVFPGMSLSDHLTSVIESRTENGINTRRKWSDEHTETETKILSRQWDIILQEGTIGLLIPEVRKYRT